MKKQELVQGIHLSWIVVADLKKAINFYENTIGLTLIEQSPEFGWAELAGPEGSRLGIAQQCEHAQLGHNATVTISVTNLDEVIKKYREEGVNLVGDVIEVPGHVRMQTFTDADGNQFQLCEKLD